MEVHARACIQQWLQGLLEAEVTELLGRAKSQRRRRGEGVPGYRNGYGKARKVALTAGTIMLRWLRMRNLAQRFESRVLPWFKRCTKERGQQLP